ncbi:2-keto-4-pentenoate hydratase [Virgibacillus pantothenticus]|uniref:2-keto-4-pentenoate hydratase n=1 Tax=Virgibacillus TaxID=84406 RepID=UPI0009095BEE|nr:MULTISPECIES: fumarylacetoacetate hydrolase family protein [Virgibacillus]API92021.1 4-oxalocrotonate decarboxylase [Virgibacillus sp. 6R]MBS7430484.1 4-oxalocrotonate decarboxylase [Virgibacillus sp. 19R1-5]MBU8566422.1 2-keto-4-pentenoate hydratase [Virgibacillus pantothenticus]MBU8600163.1 2-keto-4-pentenoate hydratase [Virgibacillus pantothenticus]MBU8633905.1 2-keto-4-pentenoate hydratase [Virgibacillus pantothenticus]
MDNRKLNELVSYVYNAEKEKREITKITADIYPELTIEEGYLVQEEWIKRKVKEGAKIIGPKMGITSEAKMKQMNVTDPIYGYVFDDMVIEAGQSISLSDYIHPKIEPEIGFILERDLEGPGVTTLDVLLSTAFVFPALEIIDSRYEKFNFTLPDVIADNTSAAGVVFGTCLRKPVELELDVIGVTLSINGKIKSFGAGAAVLGHPANSVARLANMLAKKGEKVRANQPILTGGMTAAVPLSPGDAVQAKYGGLGDVSFFVYPS